MSTLVLPEQLAEELLRAAHEPHEGAAVMLAGVARTSFGVRLLGRSLHWVPDHTYTRRDHQGLSIRSGGYVPALGRAADTGAVPVWLHTHPDGIPTASEHDHEVDRQLSGLFRDRAGSDLYASVIVSPHAAGLAFTGRLSTPDGDQRLERLWTVGRRLRLIAVDGARAAAVPPLYDRQIRAFGGDVQRVLRALRIGVIGAGGTGSAVAEQLARLGVGTLTIVDPKDLADTNLTRVYGSSPASIGMPKVRVLSEHLTRIAPACEVHPIHGRITERHVAERLTGCDLLFGCTDDNAGRLVLSRLAAYYLTPVIDCGVLLDSDAGRLTDIVGRVTVLAPGYPCLVCRGRIDLARAAAEQLNPAERQRRQDEGYAPELGRVEPAVVAYTTMVAGLAVAELLERLTGYGPDPAPSELLLRAHEREISTNTRGPRSGHYCDPAAAVLATGDTEPFVGQTWAA